MMLSDREKSEIKTAIVRALSVEPEVRRVVVFGSFLNSASPNDMGMREEENT